MKRAYLFCLITLMTAFTSCLDLDSNLFSPTVLEEYNYFSYVDGNNDLPAEYAIDKSDIQSFVLKNEPANGKLYGVVLGDTLDMAKDTVILYCHGNSGSIDTYFERSILLYHLGEKSRYSVVLFDYKGFGKSDGTSTEEGLIGDTKLVLDYLQSKGLTSDRLIIYGFSLGSIPSVAHSANDALPLRPSKLILEAPIGSIDRMSSDGSGLNMPSTFFTNHKANNIALIKEVEQDFFLFHGIKDDFLSLKSHGEPIYDNHVGSYKDSIQVINGRHNDAPFKYGLEKYSDRMLAFIIK